jgi:hypothetical protein
MATVEKCSLGRPRNKWDNIENDLVDLSCKNPRWMELGYDCVLRRFLVYRY